LTTKIQIPTNLGDLPSQNPQRSVYLTSALLPMQLSKSRASVEVRIEAVHQDPRTAPMRLPSLPIGPPLLRSRGPGHG
jgi:hypothetical protein